MALIIERFYHLRPSQVAPARLLDEVIGVTRSSLPSADVVNKLADNSVLGAVLAAGAFVCHALEHRERSEFERHLEQCGSCRSEVRSFDTLLTDLAVEPPVSEQPPAALRDAVMSSIRMVRQVSPLVPPRPNRA